MYIFKIRSGAIRGDTALIITLHVAIRPRKGIPKYRHQLATASQAGENLGFQKNHPRSQRLFWEFPWECH